MPSDGPLEYVRPNIDQRFGRLSMIASGMVDDFIRQIAEFGPQVRRTWTKALAEPETESPRVVSMTLTISVPPTVVEEFNTEAAGLRSQLP